MRGFGSSKISKWWCGIELRVWVQESSREKSCTQKRSSESLSLRDSEAVQFQPWASSCSERGWFQARKLGLGLVRFMSCLDVTNGRAGEQTSRGRVGGQHFCCRFRPCLVIRKRSTRRTRSRQPPLLTLAVDWGFTSAPELEPPAERGHRVPNGRCATFGRLASDLVDLMESPVS